MKQKISLFIFITFTLLLVPGCTIEKRLFQPGYNIEWKKKVQSDKPSNECHSLSQVSNIPSEKQVPEEITIQSQKAENNPPTPEKNELEASFYPLVKPESKPVISANQASSTELASVKVAAQKKEHISAEQSNDDDEPQIIPKKFEPLGIASFTIYFFGLALALLAIIATNPVVFISFAALLFLLSLTLGIVSVVKSHRNKALYRRNFFGYFGLIASASSLVIGLFLLLVTALIFLSGWPE